MFADKIRSLRRVLLCAAGLSLCGLDPAFAEDAERTKKLVAVLEGGGELSAKAKACRELGEIGTADAVPVLAALLDDKALAAYARAGLERIPDPSSVEALRSALESSKGSLKVGIITSLSALRDSASVGALRKLTRDQEQSVAEAAWLALGRIASDESIAFLRKSLQAPPDGSDGHLAAACLLAAQMLQKAGRNADALTLYDSVGTGGFSLASRVGATRGSILSRSGDEQVSYLLMQLRSAEPALRNTALLSIRSVPSESEKLLADGLHEVISAADSGLKVQLIAALQDCHNGDSFTVVRGLLEDGDESVRLAATTALRHLGGKPIDTAAALLKVVEARKPEQEIQSAVDALVELGNDPNVDGLTGAALSVAAGSEQRLDFIEILSRRRATASIDTVLTHARSGDDSKVQRAALRALKQLATQGDLSKLISLVQDVDSGANKMLAASALISVADGETSKERVFQALKGSGDSETRSAFTRVLTETGYTPALETITGDLKSSDGSVVSGTIAHLSRWPDPAPVTELLTLMEKTEDAAIRRRALAAVVQLATVGAERNQRTSEDLLGWLERANRFVGSINEKRQMVSALARVHTAASLKMLMPYLSDPEVKNEGPFAAVSVIDNLPNETDKALIQSALEKLGDVSNKNLARKIRELEKRYE